MTISSTAVSVAVLSSFLFGYSICVLDSCADLITVYFRWCGNDWQVDCVQARINQGSVNAAIYLGAAAGALCVSRHGFASIGNRRMICIGDVFFVAGSIVCCVGDLIGLGGCLSLIVGRLIFGFGLGITAIAGPLYMAEITPCEKRGGNAALHGVFIAAGIFASIALGLPQVPLHSSPGESQHGLNVWYWRFLVGLPAIIGTIQGVLFVLVVPIDTPQFMIAQGRKDDARDLFYRLHGSDPPTTNSTGYDLKEDPAANVIKQFQEIVDATMDAKEVPAISVWSAVHDPFLRYAILLGFAIASFQQLCGINALMSYSNNFFAEAGIAPEHRTLASVSMGFANVLVSACASTVVDKWGRRRLLLIGSGLQTLAMAMISMLFACFSRRNHLGLGEGIVVVFCFSLFATSFSAGLGGVTSLYLSEIYPVEIRCVAMSICGVINWLSCFLVVFGARLLSLIESCHVFGAINAVGFLVMYLWVVETKGCSLDDSPLTPRSGRSASTTLNSARKTPPLTGSLDVSRSASVDSAFDYEIFRSDDP